MSPRIIPRDTGLLPSLDESRMGEGSDKQLQDKSEFTQPSESFLRERESLFPQVVDEREESVDPPSDIDRLLSRKK